MRELNGVIRKFGEMVICQWSPQSDPPHPVILLLHGLTGDEHSMSIFINRLPEDFLLISPRGLFSTRLGGFNWQGSEPNGWPAYTDFLNSIEGLFGLLNPDNFPTANLNTINLLGFSQGAALAYTMALVAPSKIGKVAGISGFMPENTDGLIESRPLIGKEIFVAHGVHDDMVPIEKARQVVEALKKGGAKVDYCEENVGHKLSASCFRGIEIYFID